LKTRTVYRLTLVKERNVAEIREYAALVSLGEPHFIEVKGVTFCGDSKGSGISMKSVPFHSEVVEFAKQFVAVLDTQPDTMGKYAVACEHEHSLCVLIAHTRYRIDGQWFTHIDYEKFNTAWRQWREGEEGRREEKEERAGEQSGKYGAARGENGGGVGRVESPANRINVMSYIAPTPPWAVLGAREAGFDPKEKRVANKARRPRPGGGGGFESGGKSQLGERGGEDETAGAAD
jgi:tRNA wybutosine-synthesizing protein 1